METSQSANNESLSYLQDYGGSDSENETNNDIALPNTKDEPVNTVNNNKMVIEDLRDNENNNRQVTENSGPSPSTSASFGNLMLLNVLDNETLEESEKMKELVRKNNIINACAHGPVSVVSFLRRENSDRQMIIQDDGDDLMEYHVSEYRDDSGSDDDTSSSDMESVKELECLSDSEEEDEGAATASATVSKRPIVKMKGELGLEDLPPIQDLTISVPEQCTTLMGKVCNIVDQMVVVQSLPNMPSLNIDTVLFLEKGAKTLGQIFDVFGQVHEPYYCVRFNSIEHIKEKGIESGMSVYCAPKTDHTNYIFVSELMKMRGSDASWVNDDEPPPQFLDYSDDESERRAKKDKRDQRKQPEQKKSNGESTNQAKKTTQTPVRRALHNHRQQNPFRAISQRPPQPLFNQAIPPAAMFANRFTTPPPGFDNAARSFQNVPPGFENVQPRSGHMPMLRPHIPSFGGMPFFPPPPRFGFIWPSVGVRGTGPRRPRDWKNGT